MACSAPLKPVSVARQNYIIGTGGYLQSSASIDSMILPYRQPLEVSMREVIVQSDAQASKGLPESSLGNLICDLLLDIGEKKTGKRPDIAFLNSGGLRVELPKGDITRSMVFELMPFDNELVIVEVKGNDLLLLFHQIAERKGGPVGGVHMAISSKGASDILIGGKTFNPEQTYTVISSDYILNGGDKYIMPPFQVRNDLHILLRNGLLEEMSARHSANIPLHPTTDGRIYLLDTP